jgi:hypothetical protein
MLPRIDLRQMVVSCRHQGGTTTELIGCRIGTSIECEFFHGCLAKCL